MDTKKILQFFSSSEEFDGTEWILKYQIFAILIISFFFGAGVLVFSVFRLREENLIVGLSQLFLGIFLLYGFFRLRQDKTLYHGYSILFMILFFSYTAIIFFFVPQNHLNILWVISAPILIFFFLNRTGGTIMFAMVCLFILYLITTDYPYTLAEYVTLIAAFFITTFVMYTYEKVKEAEKLRLTLYNQELKQKVALKTKELAHFNMTLQEQIQAEVNQRLAQEQMLLHQCRMASMGEMIDSIAHQWRQPLMHINAILMNVDRSIETDTDLHTYIPDKIDELGELTQYMSQTIEDFRHLFKKGRETTDFEIRKLLEDVLLIMKNRLNGITITVQDYHPKQLSAHKNELFQVLVSLLSNAAEALSSSAQDQPHIWITLKHTTEHSIFTIEDNAKGIPSNVLEKIFDPYYTTKKTEGGSGLGLYISKIIIERNMHGTLSAKNGTQGAMFIIQLPHNTPENNQSVR